MSLLKNVKQLFFLRVFGQLLTLLSVIYFTRSLPPGTLGEYFYFESLRGMAGLLVSFGVGGATEKFASENEDPDGWYSTGLVMTTALAVIGSILFLGVQYAFDGIIAQEYLIYFIVALTGQQFISFYKHIFRADLRAAVGGFVNLLRVIAFVIGAVAAVRLGMGALGIIASATFARLLVIPVSIYFTNRKFTIPSIEMANKLIGFAKYYFLTVIGSKILYFADIVLIGILLTKADVGLYEVAWRLMLAAIILNGILANTIFSYISKADSLNNTKQIRDDIETSLRFVLILPFAGVIGAAIIGSDVLALLFTAEYVSNEYLLSVLMSGFIFQSIYFLFSRSLVAMNKPKVSFYGTATTIISNLGLNLMLIPRFGIIGAAFATSASFVIAAVVHVLLLRQFVSFSFPKYRFLIQFISACTMGVCVWFVKTRVIFSGNTETILLIILGATIYTILLLSIERTREDLFSFLRHSSG
ncbi:flippase [Natronomonas gomsonensis]|uniref:flippase n=1 Tax=Natronomonas gomsonensis TaxID=1046043 RepID=UPI001FEA86DE|nr:flippase [Natronomonas gomsonensis]